MTSLRRLSHAHEERVGALLIRLRVASVVEERRLTIQVSSTTDVEVGPQESATFRTRAEALAWVDQWLEAVTSWR